MPDIHIQHIDSLMAERIHSLARRRQWSVNDVLLMALRRGLGMDPDELTAEGELDEGTVVLSGQWDAQERQAFEEAIEAMASAPDAQFGQPPKHA